MTTRNRTTRSVFMADFAAMDRRSVKAHLNGTSVRARSFSAFCRIARVFGRGATAAEDYKAVTRFVFKRRDALRRFGKRVANVLVAAVGLTVGAGIYLWWLG